MPDKASQTDHHKSEGTPEPSDSVAPKGNQLHQEGTAWVPDSPFMRLSICDPATNDTARRQHHDHLRSVIAHVGKVFGPGKNEKKEE